MKRLKLLAASVIASVVITPIALAKDIIRIDRLNAQERVVEIDVTPMGVVIDFGSPLSECGNFAPQQHCVSRYGRDSMYGSISM